MGTFPVTLGPGSAGLYLYYLCDCTGVQVGVRLCGRPVGMFEAVHALDGRHVCADSAAETRRQRRAGPVHLLPGDLPQCRSHQSRAEHRSEHQGLPATDDALCPQVEQVSDNVAR